MKSKLVFIRFPIIYLTAAILFLLLAVTSNKLYLLVFLLYTFLLFFAFRLSLTKSIFATLLLSLPLERGLRDWIIEVVPSGPESWIPGYSFYIGFSLKFILFTILLLLIVVSKEKFPQIVKEIKIQWVLIAFMLMSIISTLFAENINLGLLGVIRIVFFVGLYLVSVRFFTHSDLKRHFPKLIVLFLLFFGLLGSWQFLNKQPIGLFLEDLGSSGLFGYMTTDGEKLYRVSGFTGHPTFFGSFLSLLIPVGFGFILNLLERKKTHGAGFYLIALAVFLGCMALFATFSRSGWIALTVGILLFLWRIQKTNKKIFHFKVLASVIIVVGIFITLFGPLVFSRLFSFSDILSIGNARGRINLIQQAGIMIKQLPFFGVGLNHFTKIMARQDLSLEAKTFLYPVHNTFILFFSEIGIPAGFLFLTFVGISLYKTWNVAKKGWVNFGIWVGAFSFLINAQFHTLFSLDPTLDLFVVMLAYLSIL